MAIGIKIFVSVLVLLFLCYIIHILKKDRIEFKYAFVWIGIGFLILILTIFPQILTGLSNFLGVGLPVNLVYFLGILLNLVITFAITKSYSKMKKNIYRNTQYIAILENHILSDQVKE